MMYANVKTQYERLKGQLVRGFREIAKVYLDGFGHPSLRSKTPGLLWRA
jgi:hypothetical protein